jgi:hypothetical protein
MGVDVVTAANPAQCEAKRFDETAEIGKSDVSQVTRCKALPELLSPRTRHSGISDPSSLTSTIKLP